MPAKQLLWNFYKAHSSKILLVLGLNFFANFISLLLPLIIAQTSAIIFEYQSIKGRLLETMGIAVQFSFWNWAVILGVGVGVKAILDYFSSLETGKLSESFLFWLRKLLFNHQLHMDIQHYESKGTGRYLLRFSGDLSSLQKFLSKGIIQFISDVLLVTMGLSLMLWIESKLGLLILIALILLYLPVRIINQRLDTLEVFRRNKKSALLGFVNSRLLNITAVKGLNKEQPEMSSFERQARKIKNLGIQYYNWVSLLNSLIPFVIYGLLLGVFVCIFVWREQGYTVAFDSVFAIILILIQMKATLIRLFKVGLVWKKGSISLRKLELLLQKSLEKGYVQAEKKLKAKSLLFENVSLDFDGRTILENLSFQLQPKQIVIIEGASGSGKTTIVKLIAGLYTPSQGSLSLDKHQYSDLHPKVIRRQFAFISDIFPLYGKTLGGAIAYSKNHLRKANQAFQTWQQEFSELQSLSFDMPLNEITRLSKHQIQILTWLRAVLTEKIFFVIDAPLHNLPADMRYRLLQKLPSQSGLLFLMDEQQDLDGLFPDDSITFKYLLKTQKNDITASNI